VRQYTQGLNCDGGRVSHIYDATELGALTLRVQTAVLLVATSVDELRVPTCRAAPWTPLWFVEEEAPHGAPHCRATGAVGHRPNGQVSSVECTARAAIQREQNRSYVQPFRPANPKKPTYGSGAPLHATRYALIVDTDTPMPLDPNQVEDPSNGRHRLAEDEAALDCVGKAACLGSRRSPEIAAR